MSGAARSGKEQLLRILLIDDDEAEYILLGEMVSSTPNGDTLLGFDVDWVSTYEQALAAFADCAYDVYLLDYRLGPRTGLDLMREPVVRDCPRPIIMLTGHDDYAIDMAAMQLGAADYLVKGQLTRPSLERSVRYAVERRNVQRDLQRVVQERTRDLALLEKQAQAMNALQKATLSLLSTLDLPLLMGQILDAAQEAIPAAEQAWLCLVDQSVDRTSGLAGILDDVRVYEIELPGGTDDPIKAIGTGQTLLIADAREDPLLHAILPEERRSGPVHSAVIAPLARGQELFGALVLTSAWPSSFSEATQGLLASFAATATAAIHNAILYREVQNLATVDPLTRRLNRRTFFEFGERELERARRYGRPLSAIMLDVDWFKRVNDIYGHSAGDQVLVGIVERCCSVIRRVDILGRYGGDEFAIFLPEADRVLASEIANRVRNAVFQSPITTDAGAIRVSVSIGIAESSGETADVSSMLKRADQALYESKQAGRNTITVFADDG
jgi:diguanylate cyclase (GGDEF)-like protein